MADAPHSSRCRGSDIAGSVDFVATRATGIVSFRSAFVGGDFQWTGIMSPEKDDSGPSEGQARNSF
jgi:hypothetical protein